VNTSVSLYCERKGKKEIIWGSLSGFGPAEDAALRMVQDWSEQNKCGSRTAYNVWKFKNEDDMTFFLLRWAK
jgi:hypothetical protein